MRANSILPPGQPNDQSGGTPVPSINLIDAALRLADAGWPVFPCDEAKKPIVRGGFKAASKDRDTVRRMVANPRAKLIGVPTGAVSGIDVLDLDYRHGAQEWEDAYGSLLPTTRVHRTMSGGRHLLFLHYEGGPAPSTGKTRADRLMNWAEANLTVPSGQHAGRHWRFRPWQRKIIRAIYATDRSGRRPVRLAVISMGRKNGKTGLASVLALAHLVGPEAIKGGQVLSGAADRAQAAIVYKAMKDMALAQPAIAARLVFRDFKKEIEDVVTGSVYQALSSDARKAHGLSPNFWIGDELAQWRGRDLLEALRTGMGAHDQPLGLVISTRSPDLDLPADRELVEPGQVLIVGIEARIVEMIGDTRRAADPFEGRDCFERLRDVPTQRTQGEPKGFNRTFQPLEQIGCHESLKAPLPIRLAQLAAPALDLGVVDLFVFAQSTRQDVADRGVNGEFEHRQVAEDVIEPEHVGLVGDRALMRQRLSALRELSDVLRVVEGLDVLA